MRAIPERLRDVPCIIGAIQVNITFTFTYLTLPYLTFTFTPYLNRFCPTYTAIVSKQWYIQSNFLVFLPSGRANTVFFPHCI